MADDLEIQPGVTIPGRELTFMTSRSSGPGGQHVNTADTRIQLRWNVRETDALTEPQVLLVLEHLGSRLTDEGELLLSCDSHRSQRRNRQDVIERLADLVREALIPPKPRRRTRLSAAKKKKRRADKQHRSRLKQNRKEPRRDDE